MAAGGTPGNVHLGAGRLYYAPIGTTEPVSASAAVGVGWVAVGYTENGTDVSTEITTEEIEVEEELDPIAIVQTKRRSKLSVQMAEMTKKRLALALGAGAEETDDAAAFEFPDPGSIVPVMFMWDSEDNPEVATNRRWIFRKCSPTGTVTTSRHKAPDKALLPVEFSCVKPDASTKAVKVFPNSTGQV